MVVLSLSPYVDGEFQLEEVDWAINGRITYGNLCDYLRTNLIFAAENFIHKRSQYGATIDFRGRTTDATILRSNAQLANNIRIVKLPLDRKKAIDDAHLFRDRY